MSTMAHRTLGAYRDDRMRLHYLHIPCGKHRADAITYEPWWRCHACDPLLDFPAPHAGEWLMKMADGTYAEIPS